jgi:hypothetical protein
MAQQLNVTKCSVQLWRRRGLLCAHTYTEVPNYLYEPPTEDPPVRGRWKGLSKSPLERKDVQ